MEPSSSAEAQSYIACLPACHSQEVLKVGVGAHGDSLKVQRDFGFEMDSVLDLSEFANMRLCKDGQLPQKWSLAGKRWR